MGQKTDCLGHRGTARSRQDESKEVGGVGSKSTCRSVDWADFSVVETGSSARRSGVATEASSVACGVLRARLDALEPVPGSAVTGSCSGGILPFERMLRPANSTHHSDAQYAGLSKRSESRSRARIQLHQKRGDWVTALCKWSEEEVINPGPVRKSLK
jgi:hypothetical protein